MEQYDIRTGALLDLSHTRAASLFDGAEFPWDVLDAIGPYLIELGKSLPCELFEKRGEDIWIARSAKVAPTAYIEGPCIIDEDAEIRHCAYIRGKVMIGRGAVIGNSVELKNAVVFDGAQLPHFNYIGDAVVGYRAHMGAGSVTSNVKSDKTNVTVKNGDVKMETGRRKFGAILGDFAEIGCNAVLNPGTVVGRHSNVYPTTCARGVIPPRHIMKNDGILVKKHD